MAAPILAIVPSTQTWNQYAGGGTGENDSEHRWCTELAKRVVVILAREYVGTPGHPMPLIHLIDGKDVADTTAKSNALKCTHHLEIHTNAGGGRGTEYWYYTGSTGGKVMAYAIYPPVALASVSPDRGVKTSTSYYALRHTAAYAGILEVLFHDNEEEAEEMRRGVEKFARAIVEGLVSLFGLARIAPAPEPEPPTQGLIVPVYRFLNLKTGVHFWTADYDEYLATKRNTSFKYEGVAFRAYRA